EPGRAVVRAAVEPRCGNSGADAVDDSIEQLQNRALTLASDALRKAHQRIARGKALAPVEAERQRIPRQVRRGGENVICRRQANFPLRVFIKYGEVFQ